MHLIKKKIKKKKLRNGRSLDQWAEGKQLTFFFFNLCLFFKKKFRLRFVRFISSTMGSHKT